MADLKALQKKIATLLYEQLSQYFNQVQILSYKPSASGRVTGKFIGDRRNYNFVLDNNQIQYLPSGQAKMDSAIARSNVQCTGSNHPCKGEKGTRCVPDTQSCKQRETTEKGLARLKEIASASKEITALVAPQSKDLAQPKQPTSSPQPQTEQEPLLNKDISLYDFLKYYSPWRPEGSKGFEKAKLRDVKLLGGKRKKKTAQQPTSSQSSKEQTSSPSVESRKEAATQPQPKLQGLPQSRRQKKESEPTIEGLPQSKTQPKAQPKSQPKAQPKAQSPYELLGVNPKDFPDEASLYKAAEKAYRSLSKKYHPDRGGDPQMMVELNRVMDKLKTLEKARKAKERGDSRYKRKNKKYRR